MNKRAEQCAQRISKRTLFILLFAVLLLCVLACGWPVWGTNNHCWTTIQRGCLDALLYGTAVP
jgi:hypothetical protein